MPISISGDGPITGITSLNTTVSSTELGYLDGTTSAIQTQINTKAADSSQGLYLITPTSVANSGGSSSISGSSVTFSGVNSISVNGIFSGTYENYRLMYSGTGSSSTSTALVFRMRANGVDESNTVYKRGLFFVNSTALGFEDGNLASTVGRMGTVNSAGPQGTIIDFFRPYVASVITNSIHQSNTFANYFAGFSECTATTQFDGITIFPNAGTITGTIRIYGYRN